MPIDWFTVGAQVLNFLILVGLLKHFLYKPILGAIDAREARITKERADADAIKAAAETALAALKAQTASLDQDRAALLQKATEEAATERHRLLTEAQSAADALAERRAKALLAEAASLDKALTRRTQDEVFAIARQTLHDLADVRLEDRICEAFTRQIKTLEAGQNLALTESFRKASGPIPLRSAFDLTKSQRAALQSAVQKAFGTEATLQFETAPDLISGIELTVGGQKLAWSIADYLIQLKTGVDEVLKAKAQVQATTGPDPKAEPKLAEPKVAGA
jgi:F-type H+-transporting ATPase subunit b